MSVCGLCVGATICTCAEVHYVSGIGTAPIIKGGQQNYIICCPEINSVCTLSTIRFAKSHTLRAFSCLLFLVQSRTTDMTD